MSESLRHSGRLLRRIRINRVMTETRPLEQLARIFQLAGEQLADIRGWLGYPPQELMARSGFGLLISHVPGLESSFIGMEKLAVQIQQDRAFWRVIQHTLRTLVYHATQSISTTYEAACQDARGIYAMTLAQDEDAFNQAFEIYRLAHQRITDTQPGLLPYLLLWHDGFGLKGIGSRANHHQRIVYFLDAWNIVSLVSTSRDDPFLRPLPALVSLAIKYPVLEDIGYMPYTGKFYYYTWELWLEARHAHPYILTESGLPQFMDLQMAFSVLDVCAIREPGSLRHPQQVFDWFELQSRFQERFAELNNLQQILSLSEIVRHDLKRLENLDETFQILVNFVGHDTDLAASMEDVFNDLSGDQIELLQKFLPRIVDYSYFLGIFRLLTETEHTSQIVKMLLEVCKYVQQLGFEGWVSLNLDGDYIKPDTPTRNHPLLTLLTDDKRLESFAQSPDLVRSEEYLVTLSYSFKDAL